MKSTSIIDLLNQKDVTVEVIYLEKIQFGFIDKIDKKLIKNV